MNSTDAKHKAKLYLQSIASIAVTAQESLHANKIDDFFSALSDIESDFDALEELSSAIAE